MINREFIEEILKKQYTSNHSFLETNRALEKYFCAEEEPGNDDIQKLVTRMSINTALLNTYLLESVKRAKWDDSTEYILKRHLDLLFEERVSQIKELLDSQNKPQTSTSEETYQKNILDAIQFLASQLK